MKKLGAKIRLLRIAAGFSQEALATKLHTRGSVVSNWEVGKFLPRPRFIPHLAQILGCEASELATLWMSDSMEGKT